MTFVTHQWHAGYKLLNLNNLPDEKQNAAKDALIIANMRAAYMVQLLASLAGATATSERWVKFINSMKSDKLFNTLVTMDSCLMNGFEEFCGAWTDAFDVIMKDEADTIDVKIIVSKHVHKSLSHETKRMLGDNGAIVSTDGIDTTDDAMLLSVCSLLDFGTSESVPAADEMAMFQAHLQAFLLQKSR